MRKQQAGSRRGKIRERILGMRRRRAARKTRRCALEPLESRLAMDGAVTSGIAELGLLEDTGVSATDHVTSQLALFGHVRSANPDTSITVEFDHHQDGRVDGAVAGLRAGEAFVYDPRIQEPQLLDYSGPLRLSYRAISRTAGAAAVEIGPWQTFEFTVAAAGDATWSLADWGLVEDTGASATDGVTWSVQFAGQLVRIDAQHTSSNQSEQTSPGTTAAPSQFGSAVSQQPAAGSTSLSTAVNPSLSGTLSTAPAVPTGPATSGPTTSEPTGSSSESTSSSSQTTDDSEAVSTALAVQWDHDGDGVIEAWTWVDHDGGFSYTPAELGYGVHRIQARVAQWDTEAGAFRYGAWEQVHLQYVMQPAPSIVELALVHDTAVDGDGVTADPRVRGRLDDPAAQLAGSLTVYVDVDADGAADQRLEPDAAGQFVWSPSRIDASAHDVQFRVGRWDETASAEVFGDWRAFALEFEPATAEILRLEVLPAAGAEGLAGERLVRGTTSADAEVELDTDGDGQPDRFGLADTEGNFAFVVAGLPPDRTTLAARASLWNSWLSAARPGSWTNATISPDAPPRALELVELRLRSDNGPSASDSITADPVLVGRVAEPSHGAFGWIEYDVNQDRAADGVVPIQRDGTFELLPASNTGPQHVAVRVISWDYEQRRGVAASWATLNYELKAPAGEYFDGFVNQWTTLDADPELARDVAAETWNIAELALENDSGHSATDGVTADADVVGRITGPQGSLSNIGIEFDHDGDGRSDGTTTTDEDGQFRYEPQGLAPGVIRLAARIVAEGFVSSRWTSLRLVLADDPDAPEAQAMGEAWLAYDAARESARDDYLEQLVVLQQARTDTLDASTRSRDHELDAADVDLQQQRDMAADQYDQQRVQAEKQYAGAVQAAIDAYALAVIAGHADGLEAGANLFQWPEAPQLPAYDPWQEVAGAAPLEPVTPAELLRFRPELDVQLRRDREAAQAKYERALRHQRDGARRQVDEATEQQRRDELAARWAAQQLVRDAIANYRDQATAVHPTIDLARERLEHHLRTQAAEALYAAELRDYAALHAQQSLELRQRMLEGQQEAQAAYDAVIQAMEAYQRQVQPKTPAQYQAYRDKLQAFRTSAYTQQMQIVAAVARELERGKADADHERQGKEAAALAKKQHAIADSEEILRQRELEHWKWDADRQVKAWRDLIANLAHADQQREQSLARAAERAAFRATEGQLARADAAGSALAELHRHRGLDVQTLPAPGPSDSSVAAITSADVAGFIDGQRLRDGIEQADQLYSATTAFAMADWERATATAERTWREQSALATREAAVAEATAEASRALLVLEAVYSEKLSSVAEAAEYQRDEADAQQQHETDKASANRQHRWAQAEAQYNYALDEIPLELAYQATGNLLTGSANLTAITTKREHALANAHRALAHAEIDAEEKFSEQLLDEYRDYQLEVSSSEAQRARDTATADVLFSETQATVRADYELALRTAEQTRRLAETQATADFVLAEAAADGARDAAVARLEANYLQFVESISGAATSALADSHVKLIEQWVASLEVPEAYRELHRELAAAQRDQVAAETAARQQWVIETTSTDVERTVRQIGVAVQLAGARTQILRDWAQQDALAAVQRAQADSQAKVDVAAALAVPSLQHFHSTAAAGLGYREAEHDARRAHELASREATWTAQHHLADAQWQRARGIITTQQFETLMQQVRDQKRHAEADAFEFKELALAAAAEDWAAAAADLNSAYVVASGQVALDQAQQLAAAETHWLQTTTSAWRLAADALDHAQAQADRQGIELLGDWTIAVTAADARRLAARHADELAFEHDAAIASSRFERDMFAQRSTELYQAANAQEASGHEAAAQARYAADIAAAVAMQAIQLHDARTHWFAAEQASLDAYLAEATAAELDATTALQDSHRETVSRITDAALVRSASLRSAWATMAAEQQGADQQLELLALEAMDQFAVASADAAGSRRVDRTQADNVYHLAVAAAFADMHRAGESSSLTASQQAALQDEYNSAAQAATQARAANLQQAEVEYASSLGSALVDRAEAIGGAGVQHALSTASSSSQYATVSNAWETTYSILVSEAERQQSQNWASLAGQREIDLAAAQRDWIAQAGAAELGFRAAAGHAQIQHAEQVAQAEAGLHVATWQAMPGAQAAMFAKWLQLAAPDYVQMHAELAWAQRQLDLDWTAAETQHDQQFADVAVESAKQLAGKRIAYAEQASEAMRIFQQTMVAADNLLVAQAAYADGQRAESRAAAQAAYDVQAAQRARDYLMARAQASSGSDLAVVDDSLENELAALDSDFALAQADADLQWSVDVLGGEETHTRNALSAAHVLEQQLAAAERQLWDSTSEVIVSAEATEAKLASEWASAITLARTAWRASSSAARLDFTTAEHDATTHVVTTWAASQPTDEMQNRVQRAADAAGRWQQQRAQRWTHLMFLNQAELQHTGTIAGAYSTFAHDASLANQHYRSELAESDQTYRSQVAASREDYGQFLVAPAKKLDLARLEAEHDRRVAVAQAERDRVVTGDQAAYDAAVARAGAEAETRVHQALQEYQAAERLAGQSLGEQLAAAEDVAEFARQHALSLQWQTHHAALADFRDSSADALDTLLDSLAGLHAGGTTAQAGSSGVGTAGDDAPWIRREAALTEAARQRRQGLERAAQHYTRTLADAESAAFERRAEAENSRELQLIAAQDRFAQDIRDRRTEAALRRSAAAERLAAAGFLLPAGVWTDLLAAGDELPARSQPGASSELPLDQPANQLRASAEGLLAARVLPPGNLSARRSKLLVVDSPIARQLDFGSLAVQRRQLAGQVIEAHIGLLPDDPTEAAVRYSSHASAPSRLLRDVGLMLKYPFASAWGSLGGVVTSGKVFVNGSVTTLKSAVTLGYADSPVELLRVTDADRANGYETSFAIMRVSEEVLVGAVTGKLATAKLPGRMGRVAKAAFAWDMAQNAVSAGRGAYGMLREGVSLHNSVELVGGVAGLGGGALGKLSDAVAQARAAAPDEVLDQTIELGVTLHGAKDKIGHAFVVLDMPDGTRQAFGFYPRDGFDLTDTEDLGRLLGREGGLPGAVVLEHIDTLTDPDAIFRSYRISRRSLQKAMNFIQELQERADDGLFKYHLASQCATFARQTLRAAGVRPFIPLAYPPLMYHTMRLFGKAS